MVRQGIANPRLEVRFFPAPPHYARGNFMKYQIEEESTYCARYPTLNDLMLHQGDKLVVEFPDGSLEKVDVTIRVRTYEQQDMNATITYREGTAVWTTIVRGVEVDVPLLGLSAVKFE